MHVNIPYVHGVSGMILNVRDFDVLMYHTLQFIRSAARPLLQARKAAKKHGLSMSSPEMVPFLRGRFRGRVLRLVFGGTAACSLNRLPPRLFPPVPTSIGRGEA